MTTAPCPELPRLQAYERGKRLAVPGLILTVYAGGWLLLAWRAGPGAASLLVSRVPGRAAFVALGLALLATGVVVAGRGRSRPAPPLRPDDPYRAAEAPLAPGGDDRPPLVLQRAHRTGCLQWIFSGPFAVLGAVMSGLLFYGGWSEPGDVGAFGFILTVMANVITFLALRGLFFRSGLVLDARRGLLFSWWGLGWPWFRRYEALASLSGVSFSSVKHGRGITRHELELRLDRGRTLRLEWPWAQHANVELGRIAKQITDYAGLGADGVGSDLGPPPGFGLGPPGIL